MYPLQNFQTIYGVDFSGAKLAGRNTWIARVERTARRRLPKITSAVEWRLSGLTSLESQSGQAARETALAHLVQSIASSENALWAIDFPFALPIEILPKHCTFDDQLTKIARWQHGAHELGLDCCRRTKKFNGQLHLRRLTDTQVKTPFDCYHYRIIYQTFHGMRDVLHPLRRHKTTAILPFDYARLARAQNAVAESCPGSTLRRLGWPHNNYKQPAGGPLTNRRRKTRRTILDQLATLIDIPPAHRRTMMRNPGADALDAVLAAVGIALRWNELDHQAIARHARYPREGFVYA
jgi:hypothetical protein